MKKLLLIMIVFCCTVTIFSPYIHAAQNEDITPVEAAQRDGYTNISEAYAPTSAINVSQTGQILYQDNIDTKWYPASMTKLMTMYLTLEAVKNGDLSLDDKVTMTDKEYAMSTLPELSNTKLYPGQVWTISDLLQIVVSNSSNAAALILANQVSDNTSDFTDKMNEKAKQLGMTHTHFVNPTGADNPRLRSFAPAKYKNEENSTTTARDYAILDHHVIKDTPKILEFTKQLAPTTHGVTYYTFNHSLEGAKMSLPGTDGLKTGSSDVANYNHTITTKRDGFRINQVILGAGDYKKLGGEMQRNMMGNGLMDYSFNEYTYKKILSKGKQQINGKTYYVDKDLYDVVPKGFTSKDYNFVVKNGKVHLKYDREFISDKFGPPSVSVKAPFLYRADTIAQNIWSQYPIFTIIGTVCLIAGLAIIIYLIIHKIFRSKH